VLQSVAVCCRVLQIHNSLLSYIRDSHLSVAVCCSVLQSVAVCCSVLNGKSPLTPYTHTLWCSVLQCVAVCCSVLNGKSPLTPYTHKHHDTRRGESLLDWALKETSADAKVSLTSATSATLDDLSG